MAREAEKEVGGLRWRGNLLSYTAFLRSTNYRQ